MEQVRNVFAFMMEEIWEVAGRFKRLSMRSYALDPAAPKPALSHEGAEVIPVISLMEIENFILRGSQGGEGRLIREGGDVSYDDICPDVFISNFKGQRVPLSAVDIAGFIGVGSYATVKRGVFKGQQVAVKTLNVPDGSSMRELMAIHIAFRREILAQISFAHPNVVSIHAICLNPLSAILDLCPLGDLNRYLAKPSSVHNWSIAVRIARDVASALSYLQSFTPPWAHLDMKSPNIMLKSNDPASPACALISDFGTAQPADRTFNVRYVDNPTWLAPEILAGMSNFLCSFCMSP